MKIKAILIAFLTIYTSSNVLLAQDQIYKKTNDTIFCKIKEIGTDNIKYILPDYPEDVLFTIEKDKVYKIVFANGKEMYFQKEMTNPENYVDNKKNAIKIDFLSPLTGNTTFTYEHSLKPGLSTEVTLGIIGLGIDHKDVNPVGSFLKFGVKFIKSPDFYLRGMRYSHLLKGFYVKPELAIGYYSKEDWEYEYYPNYTSEKVRENIFSGAIMLNIGKQWIFDNAFLVDIFAGVGYGFDTQDYSGGYHFGYAIGSSGFPICGNAGLKIGFLFK